MLDVCPVCLQSLAGQKMSVSLLHHPFAVLSYRCPHCQAVLARNRTIPSCHRQVLPLLMGLLGATFLTTCLQWFGLSFEQVYLWGMLIYWPVLFVVINWYEQRHLPSDWPKWRLVALPKRNCG